MKCPRCADERYVDDRVLMAICSACMVEMIEKKENNKKDYSN